MGNRSPNSSTHSHPHPHRLSARPYHAPIRDDTPACTNTNIHTHSQLPQQRCASRRSRSAVPARVCLLPAALPRLHRSSPIRHHPPPHSSSSSSSAFPPARSTHATRDTRPASAILPFESAADSAPLSQLARLREAPPTAAGPHLGPAFRHAARHSPLAR